MSTGCATVVGSWRPVLFASTAQQALQTVDAIATSLTRLPSDERDPSLVGGQAGLALLYAWLAQARGSPKVHDLACQCLDQAIETVAADAINSSLWYGFVGVAWAAELVDRLLDSNGQDRNEVVDDFLLRVLSRSEWWPAPHDLITGVTGLGVYALERYPRPSAIECLRLIVERLETSALHDQHGIYWWTPPTELGPEAREKFRSGVADLGVAHGVSGAISLLGAICGTGVERTRARPLLEGAVRWLLAQAIETEAGPTFPIWRAPGFKPSPSRCAWCYGDPGVAATLLVAARGAGDPTWEREAVALACRAGKRPEADTGVVDGGFCHGAAGLAHLYNRMYQATGEPSLGHASRYWLGRLLDLCALFEQNGTTSVQRTKDHRNKPWAGAGLLEGAAGIALVLLAAATSLEPVWDRAFLVSAPHVVLLASK